MFNLKSPLFDSAFIFESDSLGFEAGVSEYLEARSSASNGVSTNLAAFKNVEMERAKSDLEEHQLLCVSAIRVFTPLLELDVSTTLRKLAA